MHKAFQILQASCVGFGLVLSAHLDTHSHVGAPWEPAGLHQKLEACLWVLLYSYLVLGVLLDLCIESLIL